MHEKFEDLVSKWRDENVTSEMMETSQQWIMGNSKDVKSSETTRHQISDVEKSPYYDYHKYKVQYFKEPETDDWLTCCDKKRGVATIIVHGI